MIKPASSACNMRCAYCFYQDVASNRDAAFTGMLSADCMEEIVKKAIAYAERDCTFVFQGGEPTLAGLNFYRNTVRLQKKYAKEGVHIYNSIQTNGYAIDRDWAEFLAENHFLVGLSLDGPSDVHNFSRCDGTGKGTFNKIMNAVRLFRKFGVEFNILCVVTGASARSAEKIYRFYRKEGFRWLQFIPCLEPLHEARGTENYHLPPDEYGDFLIRLFDLWFEDLKQGTWVSVRHLDNWISILLGLQPEACGMMGCCSSQFVVEGDGSVYPCDFFVLDEWKIGEIQKDSLEEMQQSGAAVRFRNVSYRVPDSCQGCVYYALCRNGCRRDRITLPDGQAGRNYHCEAYRKFFEARGRELESAARLIGQWRKSYSM